MASNAPVRGSALGEPHVTERIVNELLTELDGLEELQGVVIIGATNRPDIIDPALLRPGRFDEMILVPVPDEKTRVEIFNVHTKKMSLADDVDINNMVQLTNDFTGADIAAVCKKAGRFAMREDINATEVKSSHFLSAIEDTGSSVTSDIMDYYEKLKGELRKKRSKQIETQPEIYA